MKTSPVSLGYFISPRGGAPTPNLIGKDIIIFEIITEGSVYGPTVQGGEIRCDVGWVFVHQEGDKTVHRSDADSHYECLTIRYQKTSDTVDTLWPRSFLWNDADKVGAFAHEMLHAFHYTDIDNKIIGDLLMAQLHFQLQLHLLEASRDIMPPRLVRVIHYIETYYSQDIGVEELAAHVDLSPSHLHAKFKEHLKMSPHQYIISERMRRARHMLVSTQIPLKLIARKVGYANAENFSRIFKRQFKITASIYRKKYTLL